DQHVDLRSQRPQYRELGRYLRTADDRDERALGRRERTAERIQLGGEQRPRTGDARKTRDAVGRRFGAMRSREGVVDVDVAQTRHLPRERFVVLLFALVEAAVLEEDRVSGLQAR